MSKTERMCKNKVRFISDMLAAVAAGKFAFRKKKLMRVYHCPICDGFHITSQINTEPQTMPLDN